MLDVIKHRFTFYAIAGVLFVVSLVPTIFIPLNLWIDMTGWVQLEYSYTKNLKIEDIRTQVEAMSKKIISGGQSIITSMQVYKISGENKFSIIAWFNSGNMEEKELDTLKNNFKAEILTTLKKQDSTLQETQYINIGKNFWDYIKNTALLTFAISLIGIGVYVAWAFSWFATGITPASFASVTILTLFHDVFVAAGLYVLASFFFKEFQIDTFFVTAILTILGYSINDTIIVFDRIRTNIGKGVKSNKKPNLKDIVNLSVNETIVRSIYTSLMLFIVLIAIFFFGPEAIKGFILVMIFGTVVGTYSSIFIASPFLYDLNKDKELKVIQKKTYNPNDKIVV